MHYTVSGIGLVATGIEADTTRPSHTLNPGEEALQAKKEGEGGAIPGKCDTSTTEALLIGVGISYVALH